MGLKFSSLHAHVEERADEPWHTLAIETAIAVDAFRARYSLCSEISKRALVVVHTPWRSGIPKSAPRVDWFRAVTMHLQIRPSIRWWAVPLSLDNTLGTLKHNTPS
jgi:hypothetical protein